MGGKRMRGFGLGAGMEDARFGFYEGIGGAEFNYPGGNFYPGGPGGPPGINFNPAGETIKLGTSEWSTLIGPDHPDTVLWLNLTMLEPRSMP